MLTIGPAPERLNPLFMNPPEHGTDLLFKSEKAELEINGKKFAGTVEIKHIWESNVTRITFQSRNFTEGELSFTDATITAPETRFPIAFSINSYSEDVARGSLGEPLCIGKAHKIDRVTFHLTNYSDLTTNEAFYHPLMHHGKLHETSWSRVLLEDTEWSIIIDPYAHYYTLATSLFSPPYPVLTGVIQIRKHDGSEFKPKHVLPVLESLRIFLSFAFANWKTLLFVVGSNSHTIRSVMRISPYDAGPNWFSNGWIDEGHGHHLTEAYPGFCKLWAKEEWRFPVTQAIKWLIEAATRTVNVEGAIAFCQIPLEMFAWNIFVGQSSLVTEKNFDNLAAADKFHLLLDRCGIPIAIPPELTALTAIEKEAKENLRVQRSL
jgi:hypothetical protein